MAPDNDWRGSTAAEGTAPLPAGLERNAVHPDQHEHRDMERMSHDRGWQHPSAAESGLEPLPIDPTPSIAVHPSQRPIRDEVELPPDEDFRRGAADDEGMGLRAGGGIEQNEVHPSAHSHRDVDRMAPDNDWRGSTAAEGTAPLPAGLERNAVHPDQHEHRDMERMSHDRGWQHPSAAESGLEPLPLDPTRSEAEHPSIHAHRELERMGPDADFRLGGRTEADDPLPLGPDEGHSVHDHAFRDLEPSGDDGAFVAGARAELPIRGTGGTADGASARDHGFRDAVRLPADTDWQHPGTGETALEPLATTGVREADGEHQSWRAPRDFEAMGYDQDWRLAARSERSFDPTGLGAHGPEDEMRHFAFPVDRGAGETYVAAVVGHAAEDAAARGNAEAPAVPLAEALNRLDFRGLAAGGDGPQWNTGTKVPKGRCIAGRPPVRALPRHIRKQNRPKPKTGWSMAMLDAQRRK